MPSISGQQLGKYAPVARQLQQLDYNNGNGVFSLWPVSRCYEQDSLKPRVQLRVEFCKGGCEERT
jgi:hypothetical protein